MYRAIGRAFKRVVISFWLCPLLANSGVFGTLLIESAFHPKADIQVIWPQEWFSWTPNTSLTIGPSKLAWVCFQDGLILRYSFSQRGSSKASGSLRSLLKWNPRRAVFLTSKKKCWKCWIGLATTQWFVDRYLRFSTSCGGLSSSNADH